jgi:glycosyltransferase involved in cell wall biosynthesis
MPGIGVDTRLLSPDHVPDADVSAVRKELHLSDGDRLFLMIARVESRKRHQDAIHAFSLLQDRNVRLAFAGDGPLTEPMKRYAAQLNVADRVHFLGFRKDVPALIRASVATALPSKWEGLSRSVMESLSLAVPVIGANSRGVKDLLANGTGLIVEPEDVFALKRAYEWILTHADEANRMGMLGRQKMAEYDIHHIIRLHEELYERALRSEALSASANGCSAVPAADCYAAA